MTERGKTSSDLDVPCDFNQYLGQQLGMTREAAQKLLAQWVAQYKPRAHRAIVTSTTGEPGAAPPEPLPGVPLSRVA